VENSPGRTALGLWFGRKSIPIAQALCNASAKSNPGNLRAPEILYFVTQKFHASEIA
jgi:hypothetical protein